MSIRLWSFLEQRADHMRRVALRDMVSLADWEALRPGLRRQYMESLGLDPLPGSREMRCLERGTFKGNGFTGRRVGFELLPDCWGSGCVFYPDPMPAQPAPGVLYVCGHGPFGVHAYQNHPILWARRGYVCMIVDTIEQADNPGEHHAYETGQQDLWLSLGYTAAGAEVWNAMRALDVLESDPHVDGERIGVTGLSGGGACSFHLAAADGRVKAVSTLCGVSTPYDAIVNRHLINHCGCIYPHNVHGHDTSVFAALIAPRPLLFCFAEGDSIFHPRVAEEMTERARKVYALYGCEERCDIVLCPGGHGDHPPFTRATCDWFDTHVSGAEHPRLELGDREVDERLTSVFDGSPPSPNHANLLPWHLAPTGHPRLPGDAAEWESVRAEALDRLKPLIPAVEAEFTLNGSWEKESGILRAWKGRIDGMDVWLSLLEPRGEGGDVVLGLGGPGEGAMDLLGMLAGGCPADNRIAAGGFEPRFGGISRTVPWPRDDRVEGSAWSIGKLLPFAMPIVGLTPVAMTIADALAAANFLFEKSAVPLKRLFLYGRGDAAAAALYCALLQPHIAGVVLENLPRSHADGAPLLGILRHFDIQHAVGFMAPRKTALVNPGHNSWAWPLRAYRRLGCADNLMMNSALNSALEGGLRE